MGCGTTKNALQAINADVQPIPATVTTAHSTLPPEVMLGFGNVLKSSCTLQPPLPSQRSKPEPDLKLIAILSPSDQAKTGHFITPSEGEMLNFGKAVETKPEAQSILPMAAQALPPQPAEESVQEQPKMKEETMRGSDFPEEKRAERIPTLPLTEVVEDKRVMTASQSIRERPVVKKEEEQAMLNTYYEHPVTNAYLELMKTQEQGKVPIAEPAPIEAEAPPENPREAFAASSPEVAS